MNDKRSVMDALDAPQWTDFTVSPQVSDDFFNRLHLEHELEFHQKLKKCPEMQFLSMSDKEHFEDALDQVQITPVKVISPKTKHHKEETLMETTVGDLLLEAMSNLELSTKKARLNQSTANSSTGTFKTPNMSNRRITRSMSASNKKNNSESKVSTKLKMSDADEETGKESNQSIKANFTHVEVSKEKKVPSRIVTSFSNNKILISTDKEDKENIENKREGINNCTTKSSKSKIEKNEKELLKLQTDGETVNGKLLTANEKKPVPSRIVTSFGSSKSNCSNKSDGALANKKRPHLLTSQIRRHSISKEKRNDQYVSLAEAVSKFQKGTPKRFRSVSTKELKPGPVLSLKQNTLKITRPISPALTCKTRVRPIKTLDQGQREKMDLYKIRPKPLKAYPVPRPAMKKVEPTKIIEKKLPTAPEPFQLAVSKKNRHFSSLESLVSKKFKQTNQSSSTSSLCETLNFREPIQKKVVHAIVPSQDDNLAVKEEELGHFGIPAEPYGKPKKFTRTLPFSFETRNKEFQDKKERKMKQIQSEEMKMKMKMEFHAKPAPSTSYASKEPGPMRGRITPKQNPKETTAAKKTNLLPFSFEERNKLLIKKKETLIKETLEKDKKAREFHAKPVPEFRPVIVRGRSRENLRIGEKTPEKLKINKALQVAMTHPTHLPKKNIGNQENNDPKMTKNRRTNSQTDLDDAKSNLKIKISSVLSELNTDKRARERKDFHDKLKRKELAEEQQRKKEEEERLAREKAETFEMRRMAEIKARPMPQYKPVAIIKSSKPLTDPQSPAWVRKSKI